MVATRPERLRAADRLRRGADFRRVFRLGVRVEGRLFAIVGARADADRLRVGLAASRRLGGAVVRNRAKRLVREAVRRGRRNVGLDLVVIPRPALLSSGRDAVEAEYRRQLGRLVRRLELTREGAAPPSD